MTEKLVLYKSRSQRHDGLIDRPSRAEQQCRSTGEQPQAACSRVDSKCNLLERQENVSTNKPEQTSLQSDQTAQRELTDDGTNPVCYSNVSSVFPLVRFCNLSVNLICCPNYDTIEVGLMAEPFITAIALNAKTVSFAYVEACA